MTVTNVSLSVYMGLNKKAVPGNNIVTKFVEILLGKWWWTAILKVLTALLANPFQQVLNWK